MFSKILALTALLIPSVVGGIEQVHTDAKSGATKKQMATDALLASFQVLAGISGGKTFTAVQNIVDVGIEVAVAEMNQAKARAAAPGATTAPVAAVLPPVAGFATAQVAAS